MKNVIGSYIIKVILSFWYFFIRVKIEIPDETERLLEKSEGFLLAGWHNQILSLTLHCSHYLQDKRKIKLTPLVSLSKDGEIIYQVFKRFNMLSVRGSSSRGAVAALMSVLKTIKDGRVPIFTPDGPRGPIYKLQPGVVQVASITGFPVISFNSKFDRYHEFKSWDKHRFPKFFARQYINYSKPFYIPKEVNLEEFTRQLENNMMEQVEKVNEYKF